jgi:hypothetical protein
MRTQVDRDEILNRTNKFLLHLIEDESSEETFNWINQKYKSEGFPTK